MKRLFLQRYEGKSRKPISICSKTCFLSFQCSALSIELGEYISVSSVRLALRPKDNPSGSAPYLRSLERSKWPCRVLDKESAGSQGLLSSHSELWSKNAPRELGSPRSPNLNLSPEVCIKFACVHLCPTHVTLWMHAGGGRAGSCILLCRIKNTITGMTLLFHMYFLILCPMLISTTGPLSIFHVLEENRNQDVPAPSL